MDWLWRKLGFDDGMGDIDPTLREYLKKEAPRRYHPSNSKPEQQSYTEQLQAQTALPRPIPETTEAPEPTERALPKESLYQDGRYAHLWKTYRSAAEAEQAAKGDSDRLMDIVDAYKERTNQVSKASLENCADEQWALHDCFRNGDWGQRMTMCREYTRQLERCVMMQGKIMRALGYMSMYDRPEQESERMQMHADKLYQKMLSQERQISDAKANGLPEPKLEPLFEASAASTKRPARVTFDSMPKEIQDKLASERFRGLEGPRLELAKRALDEEIAYNEEAVLALQDFWVAQRLDRLEREKAGTVRIADRVMKTFDMRDWSWLNEEEELRRRQEMKGKQASDRQ